jgi:hypothetical protein
MPWLQYSWQLAPASAELPARATAHPRDTLPPVGSSRLAAGAGHLYSVHSAVARPGAGKIAARYREGE